MKKSPLSSEVRHHLLSAAEKLKIVKLFVEDGYSTKDLAAQFGVGRSSIQKWIKLYREHGIAVFTSPFSVRDTSPEGAALLSEASTADFVSTQIVVHKQAHPEHGIMRIAQIFRRFLGLDVSTHEVRRVLREHELNRGASLGKKKRSAPAVRFFERNAPNELWHTDVMYYTHKRAKIFIIGYLDDYSRYVVGLEAFHSQTVAHTLELLKKSCADYHYPKEILTDGGRQFCSWTGKSQFGTFLRKNDIKHTICRAHHPQTNGKQERFWHTLRSEFLEKAKFNTFEELSGQLAMFVKHYNFQRPHQGIGGMTPADRFFEVESEVKKQLAQQVKENALELALRGQVKNPFYMVGRIGAQNVAIMEEKGRISMQVDGVPCLEGSPVQFNLLADSDLSAEQKLENQIISEDIDHGNDANANANAETGRGETGNHRGQIPTDFSGGEVQSGAGGLDGERNGELGLPPSGDSASAAGALGGTGAGGDAPVAGRTADAVRWSGRSGVVAPVDEIAGEAAAAAVGQVDGNGGESGESRPQALGCGPETQCWQLNPDCGDFHITI